MDFLLWWNDLYQKLLKIYSLQFSKMELCLRYVSLDVLLFVYARNILYGVQICFKSFFIQFFEQLLLENTDVNCKSRNKGNFVFQLKFEYVRLNH